VGAVESPRRRTRRNAALLAGAGGVLTLGLVAWLVPDWSGGGDDTAGGDGAKSSGAFATSSAAASKSPTGTGGESGTGPDHIESTEDNWYYWSSGSNLCSSIPEDGPNLEYQTYVFDKYGGKGPFTSGKLTIGYRLKSAPEDTGPYYISLTVKPPHTIDPDTGRPTGGDARNLTLGYSSRPVDLHAGDPTEWKELTYPDDFQMWVNDEPQPAVPIENDPGDWTFLTHHVITPDQFKSTECTGFVVRPQ
jgi:hypothetical protein